MRWKRLGLVGVAALGAAAGTGGTFGSGENVGFDPRTVTVGEGDGQAVVTVARDACETGSFRLDWDVPRTSTNQSTATEGEDFDGVSGSQTWARCDGEGRDTKVFTVPILDDDENEGDETIQMSLDAGRTSTMQTTPLPSVDPDGEIVIADDDSGLQLVARDVRVREADRVARITIERRRGGEPEGGEPMEIDWRTTDGRAKAGKDYTAAGGEVEIAGGASKATVEVPVRRDDAVEGDEDFAVGFTYGDLQASSRVTIADSTARPAGGPGQPASGSAGSASAPLIVISPRALQQSANGPCLSKRRFTIRLRGLRRASVMLGGKRLQTKRTRRGLTATVDLRGQAKGRYRLKVSGRTRGGRKVAQTRTYRTCSPKRRGA